MVCSSNRLLSRGINPTPGHQLNLQKTHVVIHKFIISCDNEQNSLKMFLISDKDGLLMILLLGSLDEEWLVLLQLF